MKRLFIATLCAVISGSVPAQADAIKVDTFRGEAEVDAVPRTVFVYDMAALDTLDALGVDPSGITSIGNTYLDYLSKYSGEAGTLFEPDFEAVHAAAPDLVILGGRSSTHYDMMTRLAPTLDMTIWGDDLVGQALARLSDYGRVFDKTEEAAKLAQDIRTAISETSDIVKGKGNGLIIMTNGPKISAYGAGSRFGWLQDLVGIPYAVADLETTTHGQAVSFEFIRQADPDWLIVVDRTAAIGGDADDARSTLDNPILRDTRAWKAGQVIFMDAGPIYIAGGGVQSTLAAIAEIRSAFETARVVTD